MRIAYLINQYPKVSHSFIRREILALERQGHEVLRVAIRGWDDAVVDAEDMAEQKRTRYVLKGGLPGALAAMFSACFHSPGRFFSALSLASRMARKSERGLPYHLIYLAEACVAMPWLRTFGATRVHAHFGTNPAEVAMLINALGGPGYSFTVHGPEEFDKPQAIGLGEKIRRADFVVAISSFGRSQLYRWSAQSAWEKIKVVHCGLEPAFHAVETGDFPSVPRLVCVGRLCEQKGQLLLVEAVHRLALSGRMVEVVLAGDGEMRADIEALIEKYDLKQRIKITGWISGDRVREEILAAQALVLPSFAEGLPVVLMEAMALRRPVLTTYVAGIPELVRHGVDGWLFPAGAVDDLVAAIESVLRTPVATLERMGVAGYQSVLERHSIDTEVGKLSALFREYFQTGARQ